MKCSLCRQPGHNRATCPKSPKQQASGRLPRSSPEELMRMLIPPSQALDLVSTGTAGDALANAMRQIGELTKSGLGNLACADILDALAELVLRAKRVSPAALCSIAASREAIEAARTALVVAEREHARAKAEVLVTLGYEEQAAAMGFRVGVVGSS